MEAKKGKCNVLNQFCDVIHGWVALQVCLPSLPPPGFFRIVCDVNLYIKGLEKWKSTFERPLENTVVEKLP